jgi:hypothetical protein
VILVAVGVTAGHFVTTADGSSKVTNSTNNVYNGGNAVSHGTGTEPLSLTGVDRTASFDAATALVIPSETGLKILIFSQSAGCADLSRLEYLQARSDYIEVTLDPDPSAAGNLPLNRALTQAQVGFTQSRGHNSYSEYVLPPDAKVVLSRIHTQSGGVWHGSVSAQSAGDESRLHGTFAARWCAS